MKLAISTLLCCALAGSTNDPIEVGFGTLAGFDYEEGMELPADVTGYDGKLVTVSGFMRREDGGDGATEYFMLVLREDHMAKNSILSIENCSRCLVARCL